MDISTFDIKKIYSEKQGKRGVFVEVDTDFYGVRRESLYFSNRVWAKVKAQGRFLETKANDKEYGEYVESLSDDEYYKRRFEYDITQFTDEELVEEINRRAKHLAFHNIGFEVKAIIKKSY